MPPKAPKAGESGANACGLFTTRELLTIYEALKALHEDLLVNPSEEWESDYFDEPLVDRKGIAALLRIIEGMLPQAALDGKRKKLLRRKYDTFSNEIDGEVYEKLRKAFGERRTVAIGYFDMNSAETVRREIDIYHVTAKYVTAFCHLRNAMRKFRTSRIVTAKITGRTYSIPKDFDKNAY